MVSHGFVGTSDLSLRLGCRIYRLLHGKIIFDEKCPNVLPEAARHRRDYAALRSGHFKTANVALDPVRQTTHSAFV